MGEVHDIATVSVINDILRYDVSLTIDKRDDKFVVIISWIGKVENGASIMGRATGIDLVLFHALSDAYGNMLRNAPEEEK